MNIIEAMKERRSVRSYNRQSLSPSLRDDLLAAVDAIYNPFGTDYTVKLQQFDMAEGFRPSTYGVIRGANDFFTLGIADGDRAALAAGFGFEQVVLKAWQTGLGTCWIAATFKGTDFEKGQTWPEGQRLRIICPVGYPESKSFLEKMTRMALRSDKRKPFVDLFFDGDVNTPASPDGRYGEALEMLRLAPSSTNSQPWRVLIDGDTVHFYYVAKSPASVLDCGIGICHFYLTENFYGRKGDFFTETTPPAGSKDWHYLVSYRPSIAD